MSTATGPENTARSGRDGRTDPLPGPASRPSEDHDGPTRRETVLAREKEQFGGIKVGSAFFGWLTATGMAVLLTALAAAAGTASACCPSSTASPASR